jgi:hypothetical protein
VAFYYPGPFWYSTGWIKNLLLFFDGLALLVPGYMRDRPSILEPEMAIPLESEGLLHILEPETLVNRRATEQLATALTDIITSGALDPLTKERTKFQELSWSRLGGYGDESLARMILEELKRRNLAQDTKDGVSIPMHPMVRSLVLVLLAQILGMSRRLLNLGERGGLGAQHTAHATIVRLAEMRGEGDTDIAPPLVKIDPRATVGLDAARASA